MKKMRSALFVLFLSLSLVSQAAMIDSLDIPSAAMNTTYKAAVVLPASYTNNKTAYSVLYLLHGGSGHFRDWLTPHRIKWL